MPSALKHRTAEQKLVCMKTLLDDKRNHFICCRLREANSLILFQPSLLFVLSGHLQRTAQPNYPRYVRCPQDLLVPLSRLQGNPMCLDQIRHFSAILISLPLSCFAFSVVPYGFPVGFMQKFLSFES